MTSLFPRPQSSIVHRSTWADIPTPDDRAHRRAVAAFRAAHGRDPHSDSRFPSERRLAAWLDSPAAATPRATPRRFGLHL